MCRTKLPCLLVLLGTFCTLSAPLLVEAQIVPDNSLGNESSTVTPNAEIKNAPADLIEGGAIRDNNLFHSFSESSVGDGSSVYFASPDGIANILTRVTGSNVSNIFGKLGVDGAASLFLLNPNGIVFGENASLDINGSFLATTADSYIFNNDFAYGATNPDTPPLLTINIPVGLQFGETAKAISNQSTAIDPVSNFPLGLQVPNNKSFALVGGDLELSGGKIYVPQGNIELGSVAKDSLVEIKPATEGFKFDYQTVGNFENINLTNAASVDASGNGGGNIQLQGKQISLQDGSTISASTFGADDGRGVSINAQNILINGTNTFGEPSLISTTSSGSGTGGNIAIATENISLQDTGQIRTGTFGAGDSGNLSIVAKDIRITGSFDKPSSTGLFTNVLSVPQSPIEATGNGGNLNIQAKNLG